MTTVAKKFFWQEYGGTDHECANCSHTKVALIQIIDTCSVYIDLQEIYHSYRIDNWHLRKSNSKMPLTNFFGHRSNDQRS